MIARPAVEAAIFAEKMMFCPLSIMAAPWARTTLPVTDEDEPDDVISSAYVLGELNVLPDMQTFAAST
jgi:hypothetical protein